jgi:hypothetical protein
VDNDCLDLTGRLPHERHNKRYTTLIYFSSRREQIHTRADVFEALSLTPQSSRRRSASYQRSITPAHFSRLPSSRCSRKFYLKLTSKTDDGNDRETLDRFSVGRANSGHRIASSTIRAIDPDRRRIRREVKELLDDEGPTGLQYQYLRKDFHREVGLPTLTKEQQLKDALTRLCNEGALKVGDTYEESPNSIYDSDTLVHGDYVDTSEPDDDDDDTEDSTLPGTDDSGGEDDEDDESGTDFPGGTDQTDNVDDDDGEDDDGDGDVEDDPLITIPAVPPLGAENRFELEDEVERELETGWDIHEMTLKVTGDLQEDDLDIVGFGSHGGLSDAVNLAQTLVIAPDEPLSKQDVLGYIRDLDTPSQARFRVQFEVNPNE